MERIKNNIESNKSNQRDRKTAPIARRILLGYADSIKNKPLRTLARLLFK